MIGDFLIFALRIYQFIIIARILISYFPNVDRSNPLVVLLYDVTEPVLQPIRQFLRQQFPNTGPFDFSPLAVFLIIFVLIRLVTAVF